MAVYFCVTCKVLDHTVLSWEFYDGRQFCGVFSSFHLLFCFKKKVSYLLCLFTLLKIVQESSLWTILALWQGVPQLAVQHYRRRIQGGGVGIFKSPVVDLAQVCVDAVHPLGASAMHLCRM